MARIVWTDQGIIRTIKMILEEELLKEISEQTRITEVKIIEVDIEEIIEMIIMKEVEVGLGMDTIPIIEGMKEATVGLDQVQELVQIEIELGVINVGNMIILLKIVQPLNKRNQSRSNKCTLWTKNRPHKNY